MDARTLAALKESIAHWERNVAAETPEQTGVSSLDCALCVVFCLRPKLICSGCPVANKTGRVGCVGSPYQSANKAHYDWHCAPDDPAARDAWRAAAQAELDFLRGLLPEGET